MKHKYSDKLWCELTSDAERYMFIKSGRAEETGIMAPTIVKDIMEILSNSIKNEMRVKRANKSRVVSSLA